MSAPSPSGSTTTPTRNPSLISWVDEVKRLTRPDRVIWCDGSEDEKNRLTEQAVAEGILIPLNPKTRPGCYLHRSNPNDVARVEGLTFICSRTKAGAGATNNWMDPKEAYQKLGKLLDGAMKGRTLYVVPYLMGPPGSPHSKVGVEITDSIYVVLNMRIMTRMGRVALETLGDASDDWNRGLHSTLDCNPDRRFICHFPEDNTIWSVGSGYGGNVLLGKKCLALRIGSYLGKTEGWMAEHMLILGLESPEGQTTYVAAAFPSACGKTNFAMMIPPKRFAGWKIWTVGDDIAWMRPGKDGRLWAINPENGYFGVVPGTNNLSNKNAMVSMSKDTIFTNVAMTKDGDVWWEGKDNDPPDDMVDWQGRPWKKGSTEKAAHPNSRFTAPVANNPVLSPFVNDPQGVPISAIIFGGRRSNTVPLVIQSFNWAHGVFMGATNGSETTAAATGQVGVVRRDPMAMLPFAGYDMGAYFDHWLDMQSAIAFPPKIFQVNWFRKGKDGKFLWPGFGENMRALKWIIDRAHGRVGGQETLLGWVPKAGDLDLSGLDIPHEAVDEATSIHIGEWAEELEAGEKFFKGLGTTVPAELELTRQFLLARVKRVAKLAQK
jgi:phosphoenolpyruvate carboxykinase (GTP)